MGNKEKIKKFNKVLFIIIFILLIPTLYKIGKIHGTMNIVNLASYEDVCSDINNTIYINETCIIQKEFCDLYSYEYSEGVCFCLSHKQGFSSKLQTLFITGKWIDLKECNQEILKKVIKKNIP